MFRVDNDFFDWYFNFFHKKWREDSSLITWISRKNVKEDDILYDRNSGIMTTLYDIENSIRNSIILISSSQQDVSIPIIQS